VLDAIVMEDSKGNRSLADSTNTDEGDRSEVFRKDNNPLDPLIASEEDAW
jgi:hypothetical protein